MKQVGVECRPFTLLLEKEDCEVERKLKLVPLRIHITLHRPSNQPIFTSIFDKTYLNQYVEEISGAICDSPYGCEFRLG